MLVSYAKLRRARAPHASAPWLSSPSLSSAWARPRSRSGCPWYESPCVACPPGCVCTDFLCVAAWRLQVTFDEKSPFELLSILNDVLVYLDKHHDVDLRDEPRDQTGQRIMQSLHLLKYKFPHNNM